jgi:hypothetical protein
VTETLGSPIVSAYRLKVLRIFQLPSLFGRDLDGGDASDGHDWAASTVTSITIEHEHVIVRRQVDAESVVVVAHWFSP